jgi:prolipoprotein diacylglyceryltransferase
LFFEVLAYTAGLLLFLRRRRKLGDHISDEARWSVITAAAIGAVIGSRVLFWMEGEGGGLGGKTIVGGLLGGWLAVELEKRRLNIQQRTGDLFVLPIAIGTAIGRIGCFLSGLPDGTYGIATSLPWGVDLGDGVPRHPTALYESAFMLVVAAVLPRFARGAQRGDLFRGFIASYLLFRLAVDSIKPGVAIAWHLTAIQWACIAGLAVQLARVIREAAKLRHLEEVNS